MRLRDLLDYIQPTDYIVSTEKYSSEYETPVLTAGNSFILGKTNETTGIYHASEQMPIILFDDFTTSTKWVDFNFKVKSSACKILIPKKGVNLKYVFYAMQKIRFDSSQHMRYWISKYSKIDIRYPDFEKQKQIVDIIDKINNAINLERIQIFSLDAMIKSRFNEIGGSPC